MSGVQTFGAGDNYRVKAGALGSFLVPDLTNASVTTSSSLAAYGSWGQLTSATPQAGLLTQVSAVVNVINYSVIFQVGVGNTGSEVTVFAGGFLSGGSSTTIGPSQIYTLPIPVLVPAGSRMAIRGAAGGGSVNLTVWCTLTPTASLETY